MCHVIVTRPCFSYTKAWKVIKNVDAEQGQNKRKTLDNNEAIKKTSTLKYKNAVFFYFFLYLVSRNGINCWILMLKGGLFVDISKC